ncbi:EF-hand calcium-binding domain-containing protein 4A isoform X1 [Synchiropus splendidus]|uniref:EF-hand calcium-binding domain-containing protein 4A isoform X1 n=1 Tax=Synchiropus splendidus TaxID=270530 RepID=UPI00237E7E96|nr:EF-hand calcium-binding domain-containing protein 4A isoform X1 [Synchiropus splendidus]
MSKWLNDDEVLEGKGSGGGVLLSPRIRIPRSGGGRTSLSSPSTREAAPGGPNVETMGKARELFVLCDKAGKGFITKMDMQRLQEELPLSPEQLDTVFESLDRESNGFLTPLEFTKGLDELVGLVDMDSHVEDESEEDPGLVVPTNDPAADGFINILVELGADKLFNDQHELCILWCELKRDKPEILNALESILLATLSRQQDNIRERESLEQALRRRESEHEQVVQSIYEEMEDQEREERELQMSQDILRQTQRNQQLEELLKIREQELENVLIQQKELESRIQLLSAEQMRVVEQNQHLRSVNVQLQKQTESYSEQLQVAVGQLSLLQVNAAHEQAANQRDVLNVTRNMQKEKESLTRQLELLRDMNKKMRDEKDAQQTQKRSPNIKETLQKKESGIGNGLQPDKPRKRLLSSSGDQDKEQKEMSISSKRHQPPSRVRCENVEQTQTKSTFVSPRRVFKVVFLGNSGVGKTSFIQHYCMGHFTPEMSATVGIDFQMKTVALESISITLQLWDTAGQERFRSITDQYYRKADAILALYDITQPDSFTAVRGWLDSVKEKMCEGTVLMLLGNKADLDNKDRIITPAEGQVLAKEHQAIFYECSAKTGHNMEELMTHLAEMLIVQRNQQFEEALLLRGDSLKKSCCT